MSYINENNKAKNEDLVFFIRVQYRCNSSWQGTIQWMDGKESSSFRSVLELGNLIDDAKRRASGNSEGSSGSKKWEDKEDVS